ncbi:unnamed protein product [Moneuplotes crassus]|uniref:Uncharacterized protein n=1 Tax=Euplotes crassus TaxID=5936 RepID=A0AAD1X6F2_EUPCR|nr:unnamed protein product [Moneuplotes crassus]
MIQIGKQECMMAQDNSEIAIVSIKQEKRRQRRPKVKPAPKRLLKEFFYERTFVSLALEYYGYRHEVAAFYKKFSHVTRRLLLKSSNTVGSLEDYKRAVYRLKVTDTLQDLFRYNCYEHVIIQPEIAVDSSQKLVKRIKCLLENTKSPVKEESKDLSVIRSSHLHPLELEKAKIALPDGYEADSRGFVKVDFEEFGKILVKLTKIAKMYGIKPKKIKYMKNEDEFINCIDLGATMEFVGFNAFIADTSHNKIMVFTENLDVKECEPDFYVDKYFEINNSMEKKQMTLLCFQNCFQNRDVWYKLRGLRNTDELFIDFADIEKAVNFFLPSLIKNPQKIRILNIEANINRYSMCYKFYQDFLFHARPERVNINLYYSHKMAYVKYSVYPRIVYAIRISRENDAVKFSRIVTTEDTQIMANHLQFWKLENETTECLISDDFCLNNGRIIEMSEYLVKSPNLPKIVRQAVNWHITYGRMIGNSMLEPEQDQSPVESRSVQESLKFQKYSGK